MGHGTTVPNEFDIDLVIYSRGKLQLYHSHTRQYSTRNCPYPAVYICTFVSDVLNDTLHMQILVGEMS